MQPHLGEKIAGLGVQGPIQKRLVGCREKLTDTNGGQLVDIAFRGGNQLAGLVLHVLNNAALFEDGRGISPDLVMPNRSARKSALAQASLPQTLDDPWAYRS